jgi:predicted short-subunit dehydrogenase-like oxidoreductase (DUF2520 family)
MRIVFIGSGNIAHFFAPVLSQKGHNIVQVYSRTRAHAASLATLTGSAFTDSLAEIDSTADVYILAIKDDALAEVAAQLNFGGKTVIHCAGAVALDVLEQVSENRAVIWSLYSVRKNNLPENGDVPLIVEGNNEHALDIAYRIANDISSRVLKTDFQQRQMLHLNAVFANNFTNHLLTIAQKICEEYKLPFGILHPIIRQTLEQTEKILPAESQTGPAIRHDDATIAKHLQLLAPYPDWQEVYARISKSIQETAETQKTV